MADDIEDQDFKYLETLIKEMGEKHTRAIQEMGEKHTRAIQEISQEIRDQSHKVMEEIKQMIRGITLQNNEVASQSHLDIANRNDGILDPSGHSITACHCTKLEYPTFDGCDLHECLYKMEQPLGLDHTAELKKVKVVSKPLDDKALQWFKGLVSSKDLFPINDRPVLDCNSSGIYTMYQETPKFLQPRLMKSVDAPQLFEEIPQWEFVPWNAKNGTEFESLEKVTHVYQSVCTQILVFDSSISGRKQELYPDIMPWRPDSLTISLLEGNNVVRSTEQVVMVGCWLVIEEGFSLAVVFMERLCYFKVGCSQTYGFSLVKRKANHPMEDYHVAKFALAKGDMLGLFAIFDDQLGNSIPAYLQKHLIANILKEEFWTHPDRAIWKAYNKTDMAILSHNPDLGVKGGINLGYNIFINEKQLSDVTYNFDGNFSSNEQQQWAIIEAAYSKQGTKLFDFEILSGKVYDGGGFQDLKGSLLLVINSTISFIDETNGSNAAAALMTGLAPNIIQPLEDAHDHIGHAIESFSQRHTWVNGHVEKAIKVLLEKGTLISNLSMKLEDAQQMGLEMKSKLDSLRGATLAFALSICGQTFLLGRQFEELPPGTYPHIDSWSNMTLCYTVVQNKARLSLCKHEGPDNIIALLLAPKLCGEDNSLAFEGVEYAHKTIASDQISEKHLRGAGFRFSGDYLRRQAKGALSYKEGSSLQSEILKPNSAAILNLESIMHEARGDIKLALSTFNNVLLIDPNHVPSKISMGVLLWKTDSNSLCCQNFHPSEATWDTAENLQSDSRFPLRTREVMGEYCCVTK